MFIKSVFLAGTLFASSICLGIPTVTEKQAVLDSARLFNVDACLLQAMLKQEGGTEGEEVTHRNGNTDVGVAQINKGGAWHAFFEKNGIPLEQLRDNAPLAILAMGFIVDYEYRSSGDLLQAISAYNRGMPNRDSVLGYQYANKVLDHLSILVKRGLCYDHF